MAKLKKGKTYWCLFREGSPAEYKVFGFQDKSSQVVLHTIRRDAVMLGPDIRKVRIVEVRK